MKSEVREEPPSPKGPHGRINGLANPTDTQRLYVRTELGEELRSLRDHDRDRAVSDAELRARVDAIENKCNSTDQRRAQLQVAVWGAVIVGVFNLLYVVMQAMQGNG